MPSMKLKDDQSEIIHYNFYDCPICILNPSLSSCTGFEAPPHWHNDIELIAVLRGEMSYNINSEIISLKENEGVFVNSGQLHYGFSKTKTECDFICILLHPLMFCMTQTLEQDYVLPLIKNQNLPYIKLSVEMPWARELLSCILSIYNAKDDAVAPLIVSSLLLKIWSLIIENSETPISAKNQNEDFVILKNMIGYIQKYYSERITLEDIASAGAVGQSKCCKLFGKYIGVTPNAYLNQYRLHQSTWYLKSTDMTITEIAQTVGFLGSSYYAEVFRKWCNKTPSEYRKANSS